MGWAGLGRVGQAGARQLGQVGLRQGWAQGGAGVGWDGAGRDGTGWGRPDKSKAAATPWIHRSCTRVPSAAVVMVNRYAPCAH